MLTQEQIDNTLSMMQMAGVSSEVLKQTRENLQAQLEAEQNGGLSAMQKNLPVNKKTRTVNAAMDKAKKGGERTAEAEDVLNEVQGKKYDGETDANGVTGLVSGKEEKPEDEERNTGIKEKLDNGGMIATGKTGRRVLVKDESAPSGYTEKKRRKVSPIDLQWADEYKAKEGDKLTTGQQQALKVKGLLDKYKPLDKKQRKSKYKVNPGPQMTADELEQMADLKKQLYDRDTGAFWYIPTDEEVESEKNARAMEYGEKHAQKEKEFNEKKAAFSRDGITVPFEGNANVIVDFSTDTAGKGVFPVLISSNGQSQALLVPFDQLGEVKHAIKDWAGDEPVSMTYTGTNRATGESISANDLQNRYPKAWGSLDFSDTPLPKLMSGMDVKDFEGPGGNYAKDYYDLNSVYHNNPLLYKKNHNEFVMAAHDMNMRYPEYMQMMQDSLLRDNRQDILDAKKEFLEAYKNKDSKAMRAAVEKYLEEAASKSENRMTKEAVGRQLENLRSDNPMNQAEAVEWAKKKLIGERRSEIRDDVRYNNAFTAQRLRDMIEKHEKMKGYLDKAALFDDAQNRFDLYNTLPQDFKMDREGNLYTITGEGDDMEVNPLGNVNDIFKEDDMKGLLSELFGKDKQELDVYRRPPHPQTGVGEGLVLGTSANVDPSTEYGNKSIFSYLPKPGKNMADRFRQLYENAGGDEVYDALSEFGLKELDDIIGRNRLGTVMTDFVKRPKYDPVTKQPVLDKDGNPVMVPRLVIDTSYLPKAYAEEGLQVPRRDRLSRFRREDGSIDTESFNAYRMAILARAIEAQKQALASDRIMAINDFQERGGLSNQQMADNAKIYNKIVDSFNKYGGNEEDRKRAEDAAAALADNKALYKSYQNLIKSVYADLKDPAKAAEHLGLDRDYPMSKEDLTSLMSRSKYIRAGKDAKERKEAFLKLLLDKIGLSNPETYDIDVLPEVSDFERTDEDE